MNLSDNNTNVFSSKLNWQAVTNARKIRKSVKQSPGHFFCRLQRGMLLLAMLCGLVAYSSTLYSESVSEMPNRHVNVDHSVHSTANVSRHFNEGNLAARARPSAFNGCSMEQQIEILDIVSATEWELDDTLTRLDALPENLRATSPRFNKYFGTYDPDRYAKIRDVYAKVQSVITGETLHFDCTCGTANPTIPQFDPFVAAFVLPGNHYDIYLCPGAFQRSYEGKISLLIHEITHFNVVLGSRDFYKSGLSHNLLAQSSPTLAANNADTYGEFVANRSGLPIEDTDSSFVLPSPKPPHRLITLSESPIPLSLENKLTGTIGEDPVAFLVEDASFVVLTSTPRQDADLFIYRGRQPVNTQLSDADLVCSSTAKGDLRYAGNDICEISPDESYTAVALPFNSIELAGALMEFEVLATQIVPDSETGNPLLRKVIKPNTVYREYLTTADEIRYSVEGGTDVMVTVLQGDMRMYTSQQIDSVWWQGPCYEEMSATDNPTSTCDLTFGTDIEIFVRKKNLGSFEVAEYEILVIGPETIDPEPADPEPVNPGSLADVDSGGGGTFGLLWLIILGGYFSAVRHAERFIRARST